MVADAELLITAQPDLLEAVARWRRHLSGERRLSPKTLEAYTRDEPLPYVEFLIARGRVLAALGEQPADAAAHAELARLRAEAVRLRWPIAWPGDASAVTRLS